MPAAVLALIIVYPLKYFVETAKRMLKDFFSAR